MSGYTVYVYTAITCDIKEQGMLDNINEKIGDYPS